MFASSRLPAGSVARRRTVAAGAALLLTGGALAVGLNAANAAQPGHGQKGRPGHGAMATATPSSAADSDVASVVEAAQTFLATLGDDQLAEAQQEMTEENATAWSNLPCGGTCRPGVAFGDLDDDQLASAKNVLTLALGTGEDTGYAQASQLWLADDLLASDGGGGMPGGSAPTGTDVPTDLPTETPTETPTATATSTETATATASPTATGEATDDVYSNGYGSGRYYLAFLGEPTADGTWMLHFGGHHLAINLTYKNGEVTGTTPFFIGLEPTSWTADDGTEYAPMDDMHQGMLDMLNGLTEEETADAELGDSFSDVLLGPGSDGEFPSAKQGLAVSELTAEQQELVLEAMKPWVSVAADADAAELLEQYREELDETYVGWSGGTGLDTHADYVRIDGPGVWIEFVCQNGVVYSDQIHYHTVYRDHTHDYGGELSF
ncbi:DUF3500 domain-containing protein [Kineosporia corallincola]|nr:DUF3500 domain-containing protein [Kineosporia corallincola]